MLSLFILCYNMPSREVNIMLEEKVLAIIEEICEDDVIYEERDINLKEEGLMDSLAFVELLVRMEEFGIEVAPTEVTYEEIDTPNKIIQYIETRVKQ